MHEKGKSTTRLTLDTFGDLLKFLRKRAQLTQRELAIAVGYDESYISRLEKNQRLPDLTTIAALIVPALGLEEKPEIAARLLELAAKARDQELPSKRELVITQTVQKETTESFAAEIPSNLPLQLTSFIGRETEIEEIKDLLRGSEQARLLTLVGAGGCGKTRLALQAAEQFLPGYPDGVWFIDLAPLADPNLVPSATATTFSILETPGQEITKNLISFLRAKNTLLLFDNCEHVLAGTSRLIESLLRACPYLQILATTREVLNISGEKQFHVSPLPTPPADDTRNKHDIGEFDSVRLFIQRAQHAHQSFQLTDENAAYVSQVCRRLDGIPLAIELAAACVGLLRVQQIADALKDRFNLLTGGGRTLPRHQTLRAMVTWSHDLLSDDERRLFRRLSVFAAGWTLEAAHAVSSDVSRASTFELLSRLVDKSFIIARRHPGTEARYTMLETLREYASDQLEVAEERERIRENHFEFFCEFARGTRLYGPQKQLWVERLDADYDNIRAAVTGALEPRLVEGESELTRIEKTAELVLSLMDYFWYRGFIAEAREWLDKFISAGLPTSPLHAFLLQKAGWFARASGDFKKAEMVLRRSLAISHEVGDKNRAAWALIDLGVSARDQGNNKQAITYFEEALPFAQAGGEIRAIGNCLYFLAESLLHDPDRATTLWEQGLEMFQKEGDKNHIGWGLEGLAAVAYLKGDLASALKFHLESFKIKLEYMDKPGIAASFEGLAQIAAAEEEPQRAAVLWGAASHLREIIHLPNDLSRSILQTSRIPQARAQSGNELFDLAWKKGESMKLEEAIKFAMSGQ